MNSTRIEDQGTPGRRRAVLPSQRWREEFRIDAAPQDLDRSVQLRPHLASNAASWREDRRHAVATGVEAAHQAPCQPLRRLYDRPGSGAQPPSAPFVRSPAYSAKLVVYIATAREVYWRRSSPLQTHRPRRDHIDRAVSPPVPHDTGDPSARPLRYEAKSRGVTDRQAGRLTFPFSHRQGNVASPRIVRGDGPACRGGVCLRPPESV